jgi:polysaccharide biosynthesis transport protein
MIVLERPGAASENVRSELRSLEGPLVRARNSDMALHHRLMEDIDLRRVGRTLWRWRSLIIAIVLVSAIISVAVVQSLTPVYTASTDIAIGPQQMPVLKLDQIVANINGDNETIATELSIIRSRKLAQKTILKLGLDSLPEFTPSPGLLQQALGVLHEQGYVLPSWLDQAVAPQRPDDVDVDRRLNGVIDAFLRRLKVATDGKSRIITVSFQSVSAPVAAEVVNTLADFYVTAQLDAKLEATKRASLWLSDQLNSLKDNVIASDDAVEKFRREHGLTRGETSTIATQQLTQIATEVTAAHAKRLEAQSRLIQIQRAGLGRGRIGADLSTLPEVLQSPLIQRLREQEADASRRLADLVSHYGDRYPAVINTRAELADVRGRIQGEVTKVASSLQNEVANEQEQEGSLNALLEKVKADNARSNVDEVQLHELEREAQANRTLYETLLQKLKETQSQQSFLQADADIISPAATPSDPSFPQKAVLILISVLTGAVLGALLALLCENMDVGLRSMEQVNQLLGLNPLGMIPALRVAGKSRRPEREVLDRPMSAYSEALRTIQTNFLLSDVDARPKTVLITSSLPNEGKSTIALSLAQTMAREGQRVLLIDSDLRRPTVHKLSGAPSEPGLVDWLLEKCPLEAVVHIQEEAGLHIMPAGRLPSVPPNLLGSQRFRQALRQVSEHYDVVLLDSAPVLAIADTSVLAALADKTIFVMHWATTSRKVAVSAVAQLHRAGADIAGAILAMVNVKSHAKDGFSDSVLYSGRLKHYYRDLSGEMQAKGRTSGA